MTSHIYTTTLCSTTVLSPSALHGQRYRYMEYVIYILGSLVLGEGLDVVEPTQHMVQVVARPLVAQALEGLSIGSRRLVAAIMQQKIAYRSDINTTAISNRHPNSLPDMDHTHHFTPLRLRPPSSTQYIRLSVSVLTTGQ